MNSAAGEYVSFLSGRIAGFLDAEVGNCQIEMDVGRVAHWRYITRAVPGGSDSEAIAERRDLAGWRQAADL